ncbi:MAG: metal ABC transporter permease [Bacteroidaceae bacterium]|nr:metal ABC transporter permease [Bacteroidaceae bacterium]
MLQYEFIQNALIGSLLASIVCGIIGTYIVSRRLVFISGGITHASFGGIGLGVLLGINPILSAAVFSILSAVGIQWFSHRTDMREDSAIAVFWTFGMSVGIICCFLSPTFMPDLSSYLFGNILTITRSDLWTIAGITLVAVLVFIVLMRPIVTIAFDREYARSLHLPVNLIEYMLMALIALTIVATLRMVGIVLVLSLLTVPQMTANLFVSSFRKIIFLSIAIGYVSCIAGLSLSFMLNVPSGASIIFASIIIYAICKCATALRK